jgi:phage shock protein E
MVADGALLLDVRARDEFAQHHLPGSMNVPLDELEQRIRELPSGTRSMVVYCRTGSRSSKAAALLRAYGYEVHDLGSIGNW